MTIRILSIIPAKGYSRGLPNKNLQPFCGKPLVQWTIEASIESRYITRTVVSSDSKKILGLSRELGAEAIERPGKLASDTASSESVVEHVLDHLRKTEGYRPETLILLQPTSPLRTSQDISAAMELYLGDECSAVISGYDLQRNPLKDFLINDQGSLTAIMNDTNPFLPRQLLPRAFRPNGAIYIVDANLFMQTQTLLTNNTKPFFMEKERSIDIDSIDDLKTAESHLKQTVK